MSNGVNFRQLALDLRSELTKCQRLNAELLEALELSERILAHYGMNHTERGESHPQEMALTQIRAAIAKARGEA